MKGRKKIAMIGLEFGLFKVLRISLPQTNKIHIKYDCACSKCGEITSFFGSNLRNGNSGGRCRCTKGKTVSYSPEYAALKNALWRCAHNVGYELIEVCDRWKEPAGQGLKNMISDIGLRPEVDGEQMSLDRINGKLGYSKENCRWLSMKDQQSNKEICNYFADKNGHFGIGAAWRQKTGQTVLKLESLDKIAKISYEEKLEMEKNLPQDFNAEAFFSASL